VAESLCVAPRGLHGALQAAQPPARLAGKVKYVGLSEVGPSLIRKAHAIHPLTCVEQEWSLWSRDIEAGIVPTCKELGIGVMAYSPLGRGFLTGAIDKSALEGLAAGDYRRRGQPRLQARHACELCAGARCTLVHAPCLGPVEENCCDDFKHRHESKCA
jgi:aryl-alcohol dehydrogenase-like predicted oxidoreductase